MIVMRVNFDHLKMEGLPTQEKQRRVYAVAGALTGYIVDHFGQYSHNGNPQKVFACPIDHGGWTQAWEYLKWPLETCMSEYGIEVVSPERPLGQRSSYDNHGEYRPITTPARKLGDKDVGAMLMIDSSASEESDGTVGPSLMGGIVWACRNLHYFGNGGENVMIIGCATRDLTRHGVANFACLYRGDEWMGPRYQLRERMPHAFENMGGDDENSPFHRIVDFHFSPSDTVRLEEPLVSLEKLGYVGGLGNVVGK